MWSPQPHGPSRTAFSFTGQLVRILWRIPTDGVSHGFSWKLVRKTNNEKKNLLGSLLFQTHIFPLLQSVKKLQTMNTLRCEDSSTGSVILLSIGRVPASFESVLKNPTGFQYRSILAKKLIAVRNEEHTLVVCALLK